MQTSRVNRQTLQRNLEREEALKQDEAAAGRTASGAAEGEQGDELTIVTYSDQERLASGTGTGPTFARTC